MTEKQQADIARDQAVKAKAEAENAKRREEEQSYVARIGLADEKIQDNAFLEAEEILTSMTQPANAFRRHWEWGRLRFLCERDALTVPAGERIESLALSPDEQWLVAGHADGSVRIWKAWAGGPPQRQWQCGSAVQAVAVSPDSHFLAVADGADIRIWDLGQDTARPATRADVVRPPRRRAQPVVLPRRPVAGQQFAGPQHPRLGVAASGSAGC